MGDGLVVSTRKCIKLALMAGLVQVAAYYVSGSLSTNEPSFPIAQPDTLLYCQSAKQIVEGEPFVFTTGGQVSTGNTTHLYPFVLALPYALGATGESLVTAGFVMNALFYLVFLANWCIIACRLIPTSSGRIFACLLLALNGQAAYSAMAQSDIGFFMMVSSGILAALLSEKGYGFGALLLVAPWCRPEGVPMAVLFLLAVCGRRLFLKDKTPPLLWVVAIAGVASAAGVFLFNYHLTGEFQFQSVAHKGYFNLYSFATAVYLSGCDALRMVRELLLGIPDRIPREMYFAPLFGAALAWLGLVVRPWRRETAWKEIWWISSCLVAFGVVATSSWQNTNVDRYLGWVLPLWFIFMAQGLDYLVTRCRTRTNRIILAASLFSFQIASSVLFVFLFGSSSRNCQASANAYQEMAAAIPADASVGGMVIGPYAYCHGLVHNSADPRLENLTGIYSPPLLTRSPICNLERLKHNREWRFDYWLFLDKTVALDGADVKDLCPTVAARSFNGESMRKTDWTLLDKALVHETPSNGWQQVDSLDVGYPEDEARCGYEEYSRVFGMTFRPFVLVVSNATDRIAEVGRAIIGYDAMTIQAQAGRPLLVVMRTVSGVLVSGEIGGTEMMRAVELNSPLKMRINVNGSDVGICQIPVEAGPGQSTECRIDIPGEFITTDNPRITLYGDHIPLAYWFYQETESEDSRFCNKLEPQDNTAVAK